MGKGIRGWQAGLVRAAVCVSLFGACSSAQPSLEPSAQRGSAGSQAGHIGAGGSGSPTGAGALLAPDAAGSSKSGTAGAGAAASATGLAASGGSTGLAAGASRLPCAVSQVLVSNCQKCHGASPIGGAPMSLVTYADFMKPAVTMSNLTVAQLALMRLNDSGRPMPPGGLIAPSDKKTLTDWLSMGTPPAAASEGACMTGDAPTVNPDYLTGLIPRPGETCYSFPSHDGQTPGDTTPYNVEPGEHYEQFYFKTPWPAGVVATRFGAKFDNLHVVHHWLLFSSAKDVSLDGTHETVIGTQLGDTGAELLGGWAVGGDNVEYPADTGLELPSLPLLNVQWHYYNTGDTTATDATEVQVCTVPAAMRQNVMSISWLGTENFNGPIGMPPHQTSQYGGTCANNTPGPITIWAFWPHMHKLGRHMTSVVTRADGSTETVFDKDFDFNLQIHYPLNPVVVLQPGDTITSTCTFDNQTDFSVPFGPSTDQEMCYQFTYAYPAHALSDNVISLIGSQDTCW